MNVPYFIQKINDRYYHEFNSITFARIAHPFYSDFRISVSDKEIFLSSQQFGNYRLSCNEKIKFQSQGYIIKFSSEDNSETLIFEIIDSEVSNQLTKLPMLFCQKCHDLPLSIGKRISVRNHCAIFEAKLKQEVSSLPYAVKVFRKSSLTQLNAYKCFMNERRILRNLSHSNIIQLSRVYDCKDSYYLCLPLCQGGNLVNIYQRQRVTLRDTLYVIEQLFEALNYIHYQGIMHRDIKLQNILFKRKDSYEISIIDFGLATQLQNKQELKTKCGTLGFMAPEMFQKSASCSEKCDIFSAGIVSYYLLTKSFPYTQQEIKALNNKNYRYNPTKYQSSGKLPSVLNNLFEGMLQNKPEKRPSAEECLIKLRNYMNTL